MNEIKLLSSQDLILYNINTEQSEKIKFIYGLFNNSILGAYIILTKWRIFANNQELIF